MINIQWTKFEGKSIATFISEELPYEEGKKRRLENMDLDFFRLW